MTMTLHLVGIIVRHGPIMRQFFGGRDVAHRNENNLPQNPDVWFAGVIAKNHAAFALFLIQRTNEKIVRDLNLGWTQLRRDLLQFACAENMPAFHTNDFTRTYKVDRKQAS